MIYRAVVMGVMGCGKSSIGAKLAKQLGIEFIDGDDLHPRRNIEKMSRGEPLGDEDRKPWLEEVGVALRPGSRTVACSALKRSYRDIIRENAGAPVCFLWLDGSRDILEKRASRRSKHFMPIALLDSQIATLEPPTDDEWYLRANIKNRPEQIVELFTQGLLASGKKFSP